MRVEPEGREPVRRFVQPEPAERREQQELDLEDHGHGREARPPLAGSARGPALEEHDQQRAECGHGGELREPSARVLREGDPASDPCRRIAEEIGELKEQERREQRDDGAQDDEALGISEPRDGRRRGRARYPDRRPSQDDAASTERGEQERCEELEPRHEREALERLYEIVLEGREDGIGIREDQSEERDDRQRQHRAAEGGPVARRGDEGDDSVARRTVSARP